MRIGNWERNDSYGNTFWVNKNRQLVIVIGREHNGTHSAVVKHIIKGNVKPIIEFVTQEKADEGAKDFMKKNP